MLLDETTNQITSKNTSSCIIRYKVGAIDITLTASERITFEQGTNTYKLTRVPILKINSIDSFIENVDYVLDDTRDSITWIGNKPSDNSVFIVNYDWINSGYFISHQILKYLIEDFNGRIFRILNQYGIDVIDSKGVEDISQIYTNDAFSVLVYEFTITYPFTWTTTLSVEDTVIADNIIIDLYLNEIDCGTVEYHKS
jgi:hypothetical protein